MSRQDMFEWMKRGGGVRPASKPDQYRILESMGLLHPQYHHFGKQVVADPSKLESALQGDSSFLVIAQPIVPREERKTCFDVRSIDDFIRFSQGLPDVEFEFSFIEQISGVHGSYLGVGLSDAQGNVLIECTAKPFDTQIHIFTRGSSLPLEISFLKFSDFGDLEFARLGEPSPDYMRVRRTARELEWHYGYFEFVYGTTERAGLGCYFTEHQSSSAYAVPLTDYTGINAGYRKNMRVCAAALKQRWG
jgi:hypothetical protein